MYDINKLFNVPKIAYYGAYMEFINFPEYISCDVIPIPGKYDVKHVSFGFQKNSPYLNVFNYYLMAMEERGISQQILEKYAASPPFCPDKSGQALGLDSCFTGFYVLFAGFIVGFSLFLLEIVLSKLFGIDISKHYETVFVPLCHNCRIKTDGNSLIKESP